MKRSLLLASHIAICGGTKRRSSFGVSTTTVDQRRVECAAVHELEHQTQRKSIVARLGREALDFYCDDLAFDETEEVCCFS